MYVQPAMSPVRRIGRGYTVIGYTRTLPLCCIAAYCSKCGPFSVQLFCHGDTQSMWKVKVTTRTVRKVLTQGLSVQKLWTMYNQYFWKYGQSISFIIVTLNKVKCQGHQSHRNSLAFIKENKVIAIRVIRQNETREKEEIWLSPVTKALTTTENSQKAKWQHKNATKNFDYTTIADWLRTVSWSNDGHPTGVVKPVYGIPTFPLTAKPV